MRVPVVKQLRKKDNEANKFDRNQTVFKDWRAPSDKDLEKMVAHDI